MKKPNVLLLIFFVVSCLVSNGVSARTLIISDIDDTIKNTEVLHPKEAAKKAFKTNLPFLGMSELYQQIIDHELKNYFEVEMVYLSNAPIKIFGKTHRKFLMENHFPKGEVFLRNKLSNKNHKITSIETLLRKYRPKKVILIGDNGEHDAEIYQMAKELYFEKYQVETSLAFIRHAYPSYDGGSELFDEQIPFLTTADLAIKLFQVGQFSKTQTLKTLQDHSKSIEPGLPQWIDCREFYQQQLGPLLNYNENDEEILSLVENGRILLKNRCQ